jgi:hypothetical protein
VKQDVIPLPVPAPVASPPTLLDSPATGSEESSATGSEVAHTTKPKRVRVVRPEAEETDDPLTSAVREMLGKPYASDTDKGPFTVSTVKMPSEVWERLGWVSKLIGKTKQDIIAEALKGYFRTVAKDL